METDDNLDHIIGRPSTYVRKYQVFTVVLLWSLYLAKVDRHGPAFVRRISQLLSKRLTFHQNVVLFSIALYLSRNFARVVGLESPEPLHGLYSRDFFRATWIMTGLDAGFFSAMHVRNKWLRHILSVVFSIYYVICADQADGLVRRVRSVITLQHLRVSWNKSRNPIISWFTRWQRPKFMSHEPWPLTIDRPTQSDYAEPIKAWMYFNGSKAQLRRQNKLVLDVPGGGFVAMDPRCHDDKNYAWAGKLGLPVLSIDYRKAPEAPYPYALCEIYDVYHQLIRTKGRCAGLSGDCVPQIIISGDSAGGNLAVGTVLMILQGGSQLGDWNRRASPGEELPLPLAVLCVYPCLDVNIFNWMTDEQMALIKKPNRTGADKRIIARKTDDYRRVNPDTPHVSDDEDDVVLDGTGSPISLRPDSGTVQRIRTRLAMTSVTSYLNDRIISPDMMKAMILLYVGPHNRPDFATDFLLSPLRAPEHLLARFPRTFLLCGERDPLIDDSVIFAGRLRQAHLQEFQRRQELGIEPESAVFDDKKHVETVIVEGISHGFFQFVSIFPRGWQYIHLCSRWMRERFNDAEDVGDAAYSSAIPTRHSHGKSTGSESSGDERPLELPSKLRMTTIQPAAEGSSGKRGGSRHSRHHARRGRHGNLLSSSRISKLSSNEDLIGRRMGNVTDRLNQ